ncbi:MAG: hypothetical protein GPJ54_14140 [Candidatus Heimdallarchaeota archaeon]|nr:hypothetical protein [Candidatus Heimdallarchaeota archaeon]
MKFLKKLSRKAPEEKVAEDLQTMEFNQASIFFPDLFPKISLDIITKVVNQFLESGKIEGQFIGTKGWFLFKANSKYDSIWVNLMKGPVDLDEISQSWGDIGQKRVYMALESHGVNKKLSKPIFNRKGSLLYLNSFILQEWYDAVNKHNLEEGYVTFDKITSQVNQEIREIVIDIAKEAMRDGKSELLLGNDDIVRRRNNIIQDIGVYINSTIEENDNVEISYETIASNFGLSEEDVSNYILKLIDSNEIENITNYPIDGFIKTR